ncbi:MAG: NUDIX domain-containing protein [Crocinitomicaceae bacterium]|nr:NUDIX domain-containing protein [Crocinitomicaceae bacterium]
MYEVFIENKSLIISKSLKKNNDLSFIALHEENIEFTKNFKTDVFDKIKTNNLYIEYSNPPKLFDYLFNHYKLIIAAGGIVQWNNKYLFIKRHGLWDIPKGKTEQSESHKLTAIREVEEECNIHPIQIEDFICSTYHTYEFHKKNFLKKTYWYKMMHNGKGLVSPQTEEGITECIWLNKAEFTLVKKNTFKSIEHVLSLI